MGGFTTHHQFMGAAQNVSLPDAPVLIQSATAGGNGSATETVNLSSAPTDGNTLLMYVATGKDDSCSGVASTGVSWTRVEGPTSSGLNHQGEWWVGHYTTTADQSITITCAGPTKYVAANCMEISNIALAGNPIDDAPVTTTTVGVGVKYTDNFSISAGVVVLALCAFGAGNGTSSWSSLGPVGFVQVGSTVSSGGTYNGCVAAVAWKVFSDEAFTDRGYMTLAVDTDEMTWAVEVPARI